ncbi:hypothetical protein [Geobacillus stearothermophilus]|uniref:hypothetical protein n=1 Tax=Geobacillus stearothermophilus TaxID=1422 RepID=UPI00066FBE7E|nr:hypothetical protein [Geobacillus stearothermophilus]KMY60273.1 hypothetical protein AA904_09290 [Geobacillus stearothermophilus]KMY62073.1 hypothetical protein AA905_07600 [Geobacillus stearothermophilus]
MAGYFIDFAIASALIVVLTALMGNISNTIGERMFGRNKSGKHVEASRRIQQGWKVVGGKNNAPKQAHRWAPLFHRSHHAAVKERRFFRFG